MPPLRPVPESNDIGPGLELLVLRGYYQSTVMELSVLVPEPCEQLRIMHQLLRGDIRDSPHRWEEYGEIR